MWQVYNDITDPPLHRSADAATDMLRTIIKPDADLTEARWAEEVDPDHGRIATLRLTDGIDAVTTRIKPKHFLDPSDLRFHLSWAWGDLLGKQMERIIEGWKDVELVEG